MEDFNQLRRFLEKKNERLTLGLRFQLGLEGDGKWAESSGPRSKFGLSFTELEFVLSELQKMGIEDWVEMIHFHMGSQVPKLSSLTDSLAETCRVYCQLKKKQLPNLSILDLGGGIGLNYDGQRVEASSSVNYTVEQYSQAAIETIQWICQEESVEHPDLLTEAGRFLAGPHSCMITKSFGKRRPFFPGLTNQSEDLGPLAQKMLKLVEGLNSQNVLGQYQALNYLRGEASEDFLYGNLELQERIDLEKLYGQGLSRVKFILDEQELKPEAYSKIRSELKEKLLGNFSVFQSVPDSWAIGQLLPVVPLEGLNLPAVRTVSLYDLTCDSDGKIEQFLGPQGPSDSMPLSKFHDDDHVLFGIFLTGAYQDVMGDMHNLFGRLAEVHVRQDSKSSDGFYFDEIIAPQSAEEILGIVQYDGRELNKRIKNQFDTLIANGDISAQEGISYIDFYESALKESSYLKFQNL